MDTTTSSLAVEETYISCITVDGLPILPPIMTETKREEMRRYRQLAIERESNRISRQLNRNYNRLSQIFTASRPTTSSSSDFSPAMENNGTSTPYSYNSKKQNLRQNNSSPFSKIPVPVQITPTKQQGQDQNNKENEYVPINLPISTSTSTSSLAERDMDIEKDHVSDDSESESGGGNFASGCSSTGTFIINCRNENQTDACDYRSEGEVEELEEDVSKEEPKTVIRKPVESTFRRKRRARYFDSDSDGENNNHQSPPSDEDPSTFRTTAGTSSSTSLSKYFNDDDNGTLIQTSSAASHSITSPFMPNLVPENSPLDLSSGKTIMVQQQQSPSFTINTDFAATALSLSGGTEEKSPRNKKKVYRKSARYIATPEKTPPCAHEKSLPLKTTDPEFDFILTNEVPLSAQKFDSSKNDEKDTNSELSDSSDKENRVEKKRHVRKLSYTLATPSAALLAATSSTSVDGNVFTQSLQPIQSAPSSVGVSSVQSTPSKNQEMDSNNKNLNVSSTPSSGELDSRIDKVQLTLVQLQQLHLEKGKQAHLDRYLEDLKVSENNNKSEKKTKEDVAEVIAKIQDEHQKQIQNLAEAFKQQAQKMREDFEREKAKLLNGCVVATVEPGQKEVSTVSSATIISAPSPILADTSNLRNFYISNSATTPSKTDYLINHELSREISALRTGNSIMSGSVYEANSSHLGTPTIAVVPPEQLGTVGLSKLQIKIQKINPAIFRYPTDARSPLLKGLVFPDPLDRPNTAVNIPPQAYDAAMKPKFDRLTASVKGYLTRRVLHTEKIQIIIQTIRDTVELLLKLYEESPPTESGFHIKEQDEDLHRRLLQQLTGACASFHDVFFKLSVKERMAIIANDREKIRAKALRNVLNRRGPASPSKKNMSNATMKSIERRMTMSKSPTKKDNHVKFRKSVKSSAYGNQPSGSQSVKAKPVTSYNVSNLSPKRRRMSYWAGSDKYDKSSRLSSAVSGKEDTSWKSKKSVAPDSARSMTSTNSSRGDTARSGGFGSSTSTSDTFLIPSSNSSRRQNSWESNTSNNSSKANNSRASITPRFSVGKSSSRSNNSSSSNRAPWKK